MHNVDSNYSKILATDYKVGTALQIGRTDAISVMTDSQLREKGPIYREADLFAIKTTASAFSGGTPSVGNCIAKTITVRMLEPTESIPRQARLVPFSRIYNASLTSRWIPKGVFYVDTRKKFFPASNNPVLELTGYDAMMLTEQMYTSTSISGKRTDISVVREIARFIGVEVDARTVSLMTKGFEIPHDTNMTYRETLCGIAAMYAANFVMTDLGKLRLLPLKGG